MRLRIIAIGILGAVILGGAFVGRGLILNGSGGGWSHESGDVWLAERALSASFDQGRPNLTFVVEAREGDVDSTPVVDAALEFIELLGSRPGVEDVSSYWTLGRPDWLKSQDGTAALITAHIPGASADIAKRATNVSNVVRNADDAIEISVGGEAILHADIQRSLRSTVLPLAAAAMVSLVLVLLFLGNVRATALVGVAAALAVALGLLGARGVAEFREMPVLSVIVGAALAWGLATAGGLVVMARFIAERHAGLDRQRAVVATVATAGRTVAIASVAAAAAGFALWPLPTALLRSTGYTLGIAGVAAALSTVVGLGVLLAVVGVRVVRDEGSTAVTRATRQIDRVSSQVRRHPVVASVLLLAVLAPAVVSIGEVRTGEPTPLSLAAGAPSRRVAQIVSSTFAADEVAAPFVVAHSLVDIPGVKDLTTAYAAALSEIDGVVRVDSLEGSFVAGAPIDVAGQISRRFRGDEATWFNVPVEGNPTGPVAVAVTKAISDLEAPYRVTVAGPAAREIATVAAVDSRVPWLVALLVVGSVLLVTWLLRSWNAAVRAVIAALLMTAAAGMIVWLGFAEGFLASVLGFSKGGTIGAVGPPIAWALGAGIASALLILGWGSIREVFDATQDSIRSPLVGLAETARLHTEAAVLVLVPFVPLLFTAWNTGKLIGAATVGTGFLTATAGRFVALPAFSAFAPQRLWPIDLEGRVRRVYTPTPALVSLLAAMPGTEPPPVSTDAPAETPSVAPYQVPAAAKPVAPVPAPAPVAVPAVSGPAVVEPAASETVAKPAASKTAASKTAAKPAEPKPAASKTAAEPAEPKTMAEPAAPMTAAEPAAPVTAAPTPADAPASPPAMEKVREVPVAEPVAASVAIEPVEEQAAPAAASPDGEPAVTEVSQPLPPPVMDAEAADELAPAGAGATVDVASLTASVIAALNSPVPFTTEIGEAYVANPANNLSRVMEAILRDASQRGGDEVLVYGHASRDRYRWMVVDSGPSSDNDADRAHTLAEAQRFIRRVGGIVDCRLEGDFTVFIVEIPMAS